MEGTFDRSTTPPTLCLQGELVIDDGAELQSRLLEALALDQPIQIVLDAVNAVDVIGLQLLAAAERSARARGVAWVRHGGVPECLRRTAKEAGWEQVPFAGDAV